MLSFESNWPYENVSWLGRPLSINYTHQNIPIAKGKIAFSHNDKFKIIQLPEGDYPWFISVIDQAIRIQDEKPFKITSGKITNLGVVSLDIDWPSRYGPKVYSITQSGFDLVNSGMKSQIKEVKYCLFDKVDKIYMNSSLGRSFYSNYECKK